MPEHQEIEWKESWRDEYLNGFVGTQMHMEERSSSVKMTTGKLLAFLTAKSCWRICPIKSPTPWAS